MHQRNGVRQIGVVLCADIHADAVPALKFLLLHTNTLQRVFEYQFLPTSEDRLLHQLASGAILDRQHLEADLPRFHRDYAEFLMNQGIEYGLTDDLDWRPNNYILVSRATLADRYYLTAGAGVAVLALGQWERVMAPPSLVESIVTLALCASVYFLQDPGWVGHLGTKGCLFDFNADLSDTRFKALQGFICSECRHRLAEADQPEVADEIERVLKKNWFGVVSDPNSVAGVCAKMGYNLFVTKGMRPRFSERFLTHFEEAGVKELLGFVAKLALAASLLYLGIRAG